MPIDVDGLQAQEQITAIYVAYYDRAPDPAGLQFWVDQLEGGRSIEQIATDFSSAAETIQKYPFFESPGLASGDNFITSIYVNLFGRTPDDEGREFWTDQLESGSTPVGEIILAILEGAQSEATGGFPDEETVTNKIDVGLDWAVAAANNGTGTPSNLIAEEVDGQLVINDQNAFDSATSVLNDVDGSEQSVTDAKAATEEFFETGGPAGDLVLTQLADNLTGTNGDNVFSAPVTQNETGSGELANTFETGDVLDGGEGTDSLEATTIASGAISGAGIVTPPIAATTNSIENVFLTAQQPNLVDLASNPSPLFGVTIDAQNMNGVEQWWSDNSRADILVEDIRSNPADTAFGMRATDPGVSFNAYFNANFLDGGVELGESAFNFTIREDGASGNELNDITVIGVRFDLNDESFELGGVDVEAANTWAELEAALQAQLDATAGLEELTVTHEGNGQFTVTDPNSGKFVIDEAGTVITSSTTTEVKEASLGAADTIDLPTETNIFLDDAGNGSQGGGIDVGVMSGDRGVEIFNVNVVSESHVQGMQSSNLRPGANPNQYLEEVYVEGTGDLTVGNTDNNLGRALNGLTNVRVVDASALDGSLYAGIVVNGNADGRYLADAEEPVNFHYTGTANNDELNIRVSSGIASDPDFAMQVDAGAGDDLINLVNNFDLERVSLDGGEGEDLLESASDIGLDEESTPAAFANIEELKLTGSGTSADMDALPGVESVTIATTGGDSDILNLEADTTLTISGERQTLGNDSNDDQDFGTITLTDAKSQSQVVNLDNTARVDGVMTVDGLTVDGDDSAVRELTLDSGGRRETSNVVNNIDAALVTNLVVTGSQALAAEVDVIGQDSDGDGVEFAISGAALGADFDLTLDEDNVTLSNGNGESVTLTGTAGEEDTLTLDGGIDADITSDTTVTGFETVVLGTSSEPGPSSSFGGNVDAENFSGVELFFIQNLGDDVVLTNLDGGINVDLSDWEADNDDITLEGPGSGVINLQLVNVVNDSGAGDDLDWDGSDVSVSGFATVNLALDNAEDEDEDEDLDLILDGATELDLDAETITVGDTANDFVTDAGAALDVLEVEDIVNNLVITGGNAGDADGLDLDEDLPASISVIDASGFAGTFEATLEDAVIEDPDNAGQFISANNDTRFVLNENDADITLTEQTTDGSDATSVDFNSIFEFTAAPATQDGGAPAATWTIDNFVGANFATGADNDNFSILDISALGIESFAELDFVDAGGDVTITEEGGNSTWEIVLTGVQEADLAQADNFMFA